LSLSKAIQDFLGTNELKCAHCGEDLKFPYLKLAMWPQHQLFTWGWFKQRFFGHNYVARFQDIDHFKEFAEGRLKEVAR